MVNQALANETPAGHYERAVSILRGALKTETGFKKVHAAEALVWSGNSQGIESAFSEELRTEPESIIGVWRTLAQLPSRDESNRTLYLRKIYAQLPGAKDLTLLRTLETLGKLHFAGRAPLVRRFAEKKIGRPAAFARWILANSGDARDEMQLAGLLSAPDAATRGTAAYAFRFFSSIRPGTLLRLRECANSESIPGSWRTFAWSAFYVHAPQSEVASAKARLLGLLSSDGTSGETTGGTNSGTTGGTNGDKYEIGQALALRGDETDVPLLEKLMADPEIDVRVSASYALIQIDRRHDAQSKLALSVPVERRVAVGN